MNQLLKIAAYIHPAGMIQPTGVGMLTLNMTLALARNPEVELKLLTSRSELNGDLMLPEKHPLHGIPAIGLPWGRQLREGCWLAVNRPSLDRYLTADSWIYNSMETYVAARRCKRIVTVHHIETSPPRFAAAELRKQLAALRLKKAVRTADLVVAQSTFTARQIMAHHNVPEERIVIVGSGVEDSLLTARHIVTPTTYTPYVISIGAFHLRKGSDYLFAMARELQRRGSPLKVVCPIGLLGLPPFASEAKSLSNVVALDYVGREDLLDMIRGAVCMVIPSRLEGFGLTAIESMALGTPVIASNNSALPETLGDAGILVDSTDAVALADAAERILKDVEHRKNLVALGLRRVENFTWSRCMERLLSAIKRIEAQAS